MKKIFLIIILALSSVFSFAQTEAVINVIGDSYVKNHRRPFEEAWHYKMAQALGMKYNNYGRNGNCVAFDRTSDNGHNWGRPMWERCFEMDASADYVLIIAGHNDADKIKNNADSLRMFADSLQLLIDNIHKACPKAVIGYVTPWFVDRPGFQGVCKMIKKVCRRNRIPVLWNHDKKCVIQVRDADFRRKYFQGNNDTAHLNAAGHALFLPVAEQWFRKNVMKK